MINIPDGSFLGAIYRGSVRYESHELRIEIIALGGNHFHMLAAYPYVHFAGVMHGRELFRRLRTMSVSLESGWEVYQWQA